MVDRHGAHFFGPDGSEVYREAKLTRLSAAMIGKGNFRHFMQKELHEHPAVIGDTLQRMIDPATRSVILPKLPFDLAKLSRITISACGSAFYAGLVGRCWLEAIARIPTDADVASEFRYRAPPLAAGGLGIMVSQSGETADTMVLHRPVAVDCAAVSVHANNMDRSWNRSGRQQAAATGTDKSIA